MLTYLKISNFAVVDNLELKLYPGLTVITGETGAGKSIMIDALELAFGSRALQEVIRHGKDSAEICLECDLQDKSDALTWLKQQDLAIEDSSFMEIRRIITKDGRSRCYINSHLVPVGHLKALSQALINVYGQHQHLNLLHREQQLKLLDKFSNNSDILQNIKDIVDNWQQLTKELQQIVSEQQIRQTRLELLQYQVTELQSFEPGDKEWQTIRQEFKQLSKADKVLAVSAKAINEISESDDNLLQLLQNIIKSLSEIENNNPNLQAALELLNQGSIHIEEACNEINNFIDSIEVSPKKLQQLEERINGYYELSRKHKLEPDMLATHYQQLLGELNAIEQAEKNHHNLQQEINALEDEYKKLSQQLSQARKKSAKSLAAEVTSHIKQLGMEHGEFVINFLDNETDTPSSHGDDKIEFSVRTNLGQQFNALNKVASGGELSRISLAIQVVLADKAFPPTLIFDEVDVGVGGKVAKSIGKLLRQLANNSQVLCVTHLPQVAAWGNNHILVQKQAQQDNTITTMLHLENKQRINEIARMLGADNTPKAMAHAKELLATVD